MPVGLPLTCTEKFSRRSHLCALFLCYRFIFSQPETRWAVGSARATPPRKMRLWEPGAGPRCPWQEANERWCNEPMGTAP